MRFIILVLLAFLFISCGTRKLSYNYRVGTNLRMGNIGRVNMSVNERDCFTNVYISKRPFNGNVRVRIPCKLIKK
jgi:hypothetical protein